jgi:ribosome-binding factor A
MADGLKRPSGDTKPAVRQRATASQPSQRMLRVGEQVRHALVAIIQRGEINEPVLEGAIITVSEVRMSPDLKIATAFISTVGSQTAETMVKTLANHARFLRGRLAPELRQMRSMPSLRFKVDTAFENFAKIDRLLHSETVRRDVEAGQQKDDE